MKRTLILLLLAAWGPAAFAGEFPDWAIGPFVRYDANPVMVPQGAPGTWESQNVYNPAVVRRGGKFHMLFRGENSDTTLFSHYRSQIGYASSRDGIHWDRYAGNPVLRAEEPDELPGGLEDPRLVEYRGAYYCYYTAYSPGFKGVRLCVASSKDLKSWTKHGEVYDGPMKNGAIVMDPDNRPVKIDGKFIMYTSDAEMFIGRSDDLIHWSFELLETPFPETFHPMEFCMAMTDYESSRGNIVLFLGGRLDGDKGRNGITWNYALGQCLIRKSNPERIVEVMDEPFLIPSEPYEQKGFIDYTLFFETLTRHNGEWWLYYGAADHQIALAKAPVKRH